MSGSLLQCQSFSRLANDTVYGLPVDSNNGKDKQSMICACRYTSAQKWCKIILQHSKKLIQKGNVNAE